MASRLQGAARGVASTHSLQPLLLHSTSPCPHSHGPCSRPTPPCPVLPAPWTCPRPHAPPTTSICTQKTTMIFLETSLYSRRSFSCSTHSAPQPGTRVSYWLRSGLRASPLTPSASAARRLEYEEDGRAPRDRHRGQGGRGQVPQPPRPKTLGRAMCVPHPCVYLPPSHFINRTGSSACPTT